MNLEIQKLLDKATNDVLGVKQVDQEKFAKLLIQKCVEVIDEMRFTDEGPSEGASYQRTLCGATIKEYFGLQSKGPISSRNIK